MVNIDDFPLKRPVIQGANLVKCFSKDELCSLIRDNRTQAGGHDEVGFSLMMTSCPRISKKAATFLISFPLILSYRL